MLRLRVVFRLDDDGRRLLRADEDADESRLPNVVIMRFFFVGLLKIFKLNVGSFIVVEKTMMMAHKYN